MLYIRSLPSGRASVVWFTLQPTPPVWLPTVPLKHDVKTSITACRLNVSGLDYRPLSRYTKRQWLLNSYCSVPQVVYMLIMGTQVSQ
jgi:hypothetical protein